MLIPSSYLSGGTQLKSPEDAEISQSIKGNLEPWPEAWREVKPELADENPLFINKAYYIAIGTWVEEIRRFAVGVFYPCPWGQQRLSLFRVVIHCS